MKIIDYEAAEDRDGWLARIGTCSWEAGQYLYSLLRDGRFHEMAGERASVLLLTEGEDLVSFCTLAERDDIPRTELTPWIGFVYTDPAWRGRHCAGILLKHAERLAEEAGYRAVYISTGHTGLYEKYGYVFLTTVPDVHGEPSRVYRKELAPVSFRRFRDGDAQAVSDLIGHTLRTTNIRDYSAAEIEELAARMSPDEMRRRAGWTHFYVAEAGDRIVGCGAIGPNWGREDESSLFTVFVLPEYQGRGIGRRIIETLERDAYALRADRIVIPASVTAVDFYRRMGYDYQDGKAELDAERLYRLEKIRRAEEREDE